MSRDGTVEVDVLDRMIVDRLRDDGRESNRSLATALGVNESTVAARLRRLEGAGVMRVVAVTDMVAFDRHCLAFVFVQVAGRTPADVAAELAKIPAAIAVLTCTGTHDVVVTVLARDTGELADVLETRIRTVEGVGPIVCEIATRISRFDSTWAGLRLAKEQISDPPEPNGHSAVDIALVAALQQDARSSNRSIATAIGVSEATVRARLRRLEADGAVRIQAVCDVESFGLRAHGYIGVRCAPGRIEEAEAELIAHREVGLVTRTIGRYQLCGVIAAETRQRLLATSFEAIAVHPAITGLDLHESATTIKHVYTWVRLSPGGAVHDAHRVADLGRAAG